MPKQSPFKNVVAQFIGQLCLMNQATTKSGGEAAWTDAPPGLPRSARNDRRQRAGNDKEGS